MRCEKPHGFQAKSNHVNTTGLLKKKANDLEKNEYQGRDGVCSGCGRHFDVRKGFNPMENIYVCWKCLTYQLCYRCKQQNLHSHHEAEFRKVCLPEYNLLIRD